MAARALQPHSVASAKILVGVALLTPDSRDPEELAELTAALWLVAPVPLTPPADPRLDTSLVPKPQKVKDYADSRRKAALRRTAWWGWQC